MSRAFSDLTAAFQPLAQQVLDDWLAAHPGNSLVITFTLRTQVEQDAAVAAGRSQLHHSKHQAHQPDGKSWAMDVCPGSLITQKNYAPNDPLWWELGEIVVAHPELRWGGQWSHPAPPPVGHPWTYPGALFDPGHIEWVGKPNIIT